MKNNNLIVENEEFKTEIRQWLLKNVPATPLPSGDTAEGNALHLDWERKLAADRLTAVSWPEQYGGRGLDLWKWLIFEEEYYKAGAPSRVTQNGIFLLAPSLFTFGTEDQKTKYLPAMARAEHVWAQGWSEPEAGSDLAAVSSFAERDESRKGWVLTGQKTWSTRAAYCTHMFGLFRTDRAAKRHRGLTYMMIDLRQPGVTVKPFERLDGDMGFADVYFDEAFVGDSDVLGNVDEGWKVAMAATNSERGLTLRSPGRFIKGAQELFKLYQNADEAAKYRYKDAMANIWAKVLAYDVLTKNQASAIIDGIELGSESSVNKIFWSELDLEIHEMALELTRDTQAYMNKWTKGFMFAIGGRIYAGTNEIQRNIIAERLLGMPRL